MVAIEGYLQKCIVICKCPLAFLILLLSLSRQSHPVYSTVFTECRMSLEEYVRIKVYSPFFSPCHPSIYTKIYITVLVFQLYIGTLHL